MPIVQKKFYTTEYGSYRPKKNKFKLAKDKTAQDSTLKISDGVIYTRVDSAYFKNVKTKVTELYISNAFLRFFPTGQFLISTTEDFKNGLTDYNNLKSGIVGYYKIKDTTLIMEQFLVTAHDCGSYRTYELGIKGDTIEHYEKRIIEGLEGTPDW